MAMQRGLLPGEIEGLRNGLRRLDCRGNVVRMVLRELDRFACASGCGKISISIGGPHMGDIYNINGASASAIGPQARIGRVYQGGGAAAMSSEDWELIAGELAAIRRAVGIRSLAAPGLETRSAINGAQAAVRRRDFDGLRRSLLSAGKWIGGVATDIGANLVAEIIKREMAL
jgi:hypothetical protein